MTTVYSDNGFTDDEVEQLDEWDGYEDYIEDDLFIEEGPMFD